MILLASRCLRSQTCHGESSNGKTLVSGTRNHGFESLLPIQSSKRRE